MTPNESYEEVLEDLLRLSPSMGDLLQRINAGKDGRPRAQRYDTSGGGATVKFCERHEADDCDCGQATTYPAISDPTGEAAMRLTEHGDRARRDLASYHDAVRAVRKARETFLKLYDAWMPHDPSSMQSHEAEEPDPGCESCARLPGPSGMAGARRWEPPTTKERSKTTGMWLCWFCERWFKQTGMTPPKNLLVDHHDGKRVSWPGAA